MAPVDEIPDVIDHFPPLLEKRVIIADLPQIEHKLVGPTIRPLEQFERVVKPDLHAGSLYALDYMLSGHYQISQKYECCTTCSK